MMERGVWHRMLLMPRLSLLVLSLLLTIASAAETPLSLQLQSLSPVGKPVLVKEQWLPSRTAMTRRMSM